NLLHDRIEAVREYFLAHRLGGFAVAEGADLDVQQLVLGFMPDGHRIPVLLEGDNLDIGDLLARHRGDLDPELARCTGCWLPARHRSRRERLRGRSRWLRRSRICSVRRRGRSPAALE